MKRLYEFCCKCYDSLLLNGNGAVVRAANVQYVDRSTFDQALMELEKYVDEDLSFADHINSTDCTKNTKNSLIDDARMFKKLWIFVAEDKTDNNSKIVSQGINLFTIAIRRLIREAAQRVIKLIISLAFDKEIQQEKALQRKSHIHSDEEEDGVGADASDSLHQVGILHQRKSAPHVRNIPSQEFVFDAPCTHDVRSKLL